MSSTGVVSAPDPVHPEPGPVSGLQRLLEARQAQLERVVAAVALVALGMHQVLGGGIAAGVTSGYVLAIALFPVWVGALRQYWGGQALMITTLLTLISGLALSQFAAVDHTISRGQSFDALMLLIGTMCGVGVVLWSRQVLSVAKVGFWYGIGIVLSIFIARNATFHTNEWKYGWAVAAAVVLLSLASGTRRRVLELAVLLLLAGASVAFASRSYFATFLLAFVLVLWQLRPRALTKRAAWWWTASLLGLLSVGMYYLGTTLLVSGYLGQQAQQVSVSEVNSAGSLIVGGRPELAASLALFVHHPWGFGVGVVPNMSDINIAKVGLANINYDPNNNYVDNFMFGTHFELHSTAADIWAGFGLVGLILVALIAFLVVRGLALSLADRAASGLLIFLCWWTLWNLLFSPLYSASPTLTLVLGLVLVPRVRSSVAPGGWRHQSAGDG